MFKKVVVFLSLAVCVLAYPEKGFAIEWLDNTVANLEENLDEGSVAGLGVLYSASPYKDYDDTVLPVPIIQASYKGFFIDQAVAGYNVINDEKLKIGVVMGPHFGGYDSGESDALSGMEDRDWGFDGGARLKWENEIVDVTAMGLADISGTYEGQELSLVLSKKLFEGFFTPRVGTKWLSEDNVDYYYGVKNSEARVGRSAYAPDSTMTYTAGATFAYPLGDKWAAIADVQYEFFGDEIQDSPIVDEDGIFRVVIGSVYRF